MHIILLSRRHGAARSLSLELRWLLLALLLLLSVALGGGVAVGAWWAPATVTVHDDAQVNQVLDQQRAEVGAVRLAAQRQLDAFAAHVAELQARLTRLDALGARLTELADLDASEFDFSLNVGQGGAEDALGDSAYAPPAFMDELDQLSLRLDSREQLLEVLEQLIGERQLSEAEYLSGMPVRNGYMSSSFGRRVHPLTGRNTQHKGIDFAAPTGTPIRAVGDGVIDFAGSQGGYGNVVVVQHGSVYSTAYAHLSRMAPGVRRGMRVSQGDVIGYVGTSGWSTGPHLHYEFRVNNDARDPNSIVTPQMQALAGADLQRFRSVASDMSHRFVLLTPASLQVASR